MQPRIEAVGIAQSREVSPCMDERFLDRILGPRSITKNQHCDPEETIAG